MLEKKNIILYSRYTSGTFCVLCKCEQYVSFSFFFNLWQCFSLSHVPTAVSLLGSVMKDQHLFFQILERSRNDIYSKVFFYYADAFCASFNSTSCRNEKSAQKFFATYLFVMRGESSQIWHAGTFSW